MALPTAAEKEKAIQAFVATTGKDGEVAVEFLLTAKWSLADALDRFYATEGKTIADPVHAKATADQVAAGDATGASEDVRHFPTAAEKELAVRSFLDVASGQNDETALTYLKRTHWRLQDALQLFYGSESNSTVALHAASPAALVEAGAVAEVELRGKDSVDHFIMEPVVGSKIRSPYRLTGAVYNGLKDYQKEGLVWLWQMHCSGRGGILADDMGLGKTRQVASFLTGLFESHLIKRVLLVVPPILTDQWVEELETVGLLDVHIFKEPKTRNSELKKVVKDGGLLLCSIGLIPREWKLLDNFGKWDYIIVDEGHTLAKPGRDKFISLEKIRCEHRVLVTGTPVQNNLKELYVLVNFCCPGVLGSLGDFQENFLAPIVDGNFKGSTNEELIESSEAAAKLRAAIKPYVLRRLKKDIALPEKTEFTVWLKLTPYQERLYTTFLRTNTFYRGDKGAVVVAAMLLQKICNHPCKLSKEEMELDTRALKLLEQMVHTLERTVPRNERNDDKFSFSCKIEFILTLLERLYGHHKVLIFAQTREMLDEIEDALSTKEYNFLRIDGTTKASERKDKVEAFKKEGGPGIFLLSTRVGGVGLDLPIASRTIIVDPSWNPSTDNQCADRIYRVGQQQNVIVYRLITTNTVEQYIYETQLFKAGLFKLSTEDADYKRYICKELKEQLLKVPENFSTSRTLRHLVKETMKQNRSENTQKEIDDLKNSGFGIVSIHNRLFSETIQLPRITLGNWREKKATRHRSGPKYGDCVIGGADYSFKPSDGPVHMPPASPPASPVNEDERISEARARRIAFLEKEIERYIELKEEFKDTLTDGGAKFDNLMEKCAKELSELQSGTDGRANGG